MKLNDLTMNQAGHYENENYSFFWGGVFSNWYTSPFDYDTGTPEYGVQTFTSAEQAFMLHKAYLFNDHESIAKIMATHNPAQQKKLGKLVKDFDKAKWESVCVDLITNVLVAKFSSGPIIKQILLDTGDKHIVEASPYDVVWGIGMGVDDEDILDESKWKGKNFLGICLMNARNILQDKYSVEY